MKAGTTSLWRYLRAHPGIWMPDLKEPQFFSEHEWWRGLDWYESLFAGAPAGAVLGEASPSYTRFPFSAEAAGRLAELLPGAKLVYVVREPVERIVSQYRHRVDQGVEHRPIDEAVLDEDVYVATSRYAMQAGRYLERFPREQLLVLPTESLDADRAAAMAGVFRFLGVDDGVPVDLDGRHGRAEQRRSVLAPVERLRSVEAYRRLRPLVPAGVRAAGWRALSRRAEPVPAELSPAVRDELVARLRPDLEQLVDLVGGDFDAWGLLDR